MTTSIDQALEQLMAAPGLRAALRNVDGRLLVTDADKLAREVRAALRNAFEAGRQLEREQPTSVEQLRAELDRLDATGETEGRGALMTSILQLETRRAQDALAAIEAAEERGRAAAHNERCELDLRALEAVERKFAGTPHLTVAEDVMAAYGDALLQSVAGR